MARTILADKESYPIRIGIEHNSRMGYFDVMLQVGGFKDRQQATRFAEMLAQWMVEDSPTGWVQRVQ